MKKLFYLMTILTGMLTSTEMQGQISNYATLPYSTGFETGTLDNNWYTTSTLSNGRIQIWNTLTWSSSIAQAHSGNLWLGMDAAPPGGTLNTNEAWMGLDLSGQNNVLLSFWWSEWNDETSNADGVYISDNGGGSFIKILDLNGGSYTDLQWNYFAINLDSAINYHSLTKSSTFVIKFVQEDDFYFAGGNDGFMFDDIDVSTPLSNPDLTKPVLNVHVFPNPTQDRITISTGHMKSTTKYQLTSITGKQIASGEVNTPQFELDLHSCERGVYLLSLFSENESKTIRIVRQ